MTQKQSKEMAQLAYKALDDKKARDIRILDISEISVLADYFLIASGSNKNRITRKLCETGRFIVPRAYTTRPVSDGIHQQISEAEFARDRKKFIETTMYAGYAYGTKWEDIPEDFTCPLCGVGKDQFEKE